MINSTRLALLAEQLAPSRDPNSEEVKAQLRSNAKDAIEHGVFGVPTFEVDGKLFWGLDALPMLSAYMQDEKCLDDIWFAAEQVGKML